MSGYLALVLAFYIKHRSFCPSLLSRKGLEGKKWEN
jgi:hypothetical protein